MKMTFNRRLILEALKETFDGMPPHSARFVRYTLEAAVSHQWEGIYSGMKTTPNIQQIHRTLKELWRDGLIIGSRVKEDGFDGGLPGWVICYQISGDVYHNWLTAECSSVYNKVKRAKNGANLFGAVFDMGLPESDVKSLMIRVKALMQKTHPDKVDGYEDEFKRMKQCSVWIKSGIPLPTPTHQANKTLALKLTFPK